MLNGQIIDPRTVRRRRRFLLPLLAIGIVAIALLASFILRGQGRPTLIGTELDGNPAPEFTLTDYRGQTVSLSDFRGKVVALTFIYTHCPDVCPAIANTLRAAYEQLPEDTRDDVALIAITIDPEQDTSEALRAFSAQHGLADNPHWYALRGGPAMLAPVWEAYGIYPGRSSGTPAGDGRTGGSPGSSALGGGEGHTDAIYLIDPEGRERVMIRSAIDPDSLVHNLKALAT